jgi:hypothetical protein
MHFGSGFFYFTLAYTSLALLLLPWFGCSHVFSCPDTPPPDGGQMSISYLVRREPLSTTYAYVGGLFLFAVVYCQVDSQKDNTVSFVRFLVSFVAAKLLAVPLVVPLGGTAASENVHVICWVLGAFLEVLVTAIVYWEKKVRPWKAAAETKYLVAVAAMLTAAVTGILIGMGHPHNAGVYALLGMEYLFGTMLATTAFLTHWHKF